MLFHFLIPLHDDAGGFLSLMNLLSHSKDHAQHVILPPSLSIRKSVKTLSIKDES
jgi:hypothetical protein